MQTAADEDLAISRITNEIQREGQNCANPYSYGYQKSQMVAWWVTRPSSDYC